jgi:hypothetical protein
MGRVAAIRDINTPESDRGSRNNPQQVFVKSKAGSANPGGIHGVVVAQISRSPAIHARIPWRRRRLRKSGEDESEHWGHQAYDDEHPRCARATTKTCEAASQRDDGHAVCTQRTAIAGARR